MRKKITGIMVYYYVVCKQKLWYFVHDINMEQNNDNVRLGRLLDENSYRDADKHILIDNALNIDYIKNANIIHEIKKSRKIEEASIWQVRYYIWYLEQFGVPNIKGQIDYPLLRQTVQVELSDADREIMQDYLADIERIISLQQPPDVKQRKKICQSCAYFELCYI